jgi:alkylation response protein AidB-like acyl-CoA dehydrogenase
MTATGEARRTGGDVLSCALELVDEIAREADAIERAGRLPEPLLAALADAGCTRMAVPERYGGADLPLPAVLSVLEALARGDGSVGWTIGQLALSHVLVSYLPPAGLDRIYADGPDVWVAGAAAPKGRAGREDSGWRVSGRWPLVSGVPYAAWVFVQCVVVSEDRTIQTQPGGIPELRMAVLPAADIEVIETWDALGLRGTASHDVQVRATHCPDSLTCQLTPDAPAGGKLCRVPPQAQGGPLIAATALGIAQGALDALAELAGGGKRPAFSPRRLAESEAFQERFGEARLTLAAARALLHTEATRADARGLQGPLTPVDRARLRAAAVKAVELASTVTDAAFSLAGASSVYSSSPLQRRLRDARTGAQHFAAGREFYTPLGALLAGETPTGPLP